MIETGLQHGTLTVMVNYVGYEITTYRTDGEYTDHRHPDSVQFVGRLQEDLMRRDFTINAMAADISGKIRDFYDGQFDLEHKSGFAALVILINALRKILIAYSLGLCGLNLSWAFTIEENRRFYA